MATSSGGLPVAIGLVSVGALLVYSAFKGGSIMDVFADDLPKTTPGPSPDAQDSARGVSAADPGGLGALSAGGSFAGSKIRADALRAVAFAAAPSVKVISSKRSTRGTASGGISDHWIGSTEAYAYDLSDGSSPTPGMDRAAIAIMAALGETYDGQSELSFTKVIGGYRYQVLYRTQVGGNHDNHVHVGVKRV